MKARRQLSDPFIILPVFGRQPALLYQHWPLTSSDMPSIVTGVHHVTMAFATLRMRHRTVCQLMAHRAKHGGEGFHDRNARTGSTSSCADTFIPGNAACLSVQSGLLRQPKMQATVARVPCQGASLRQLVAFSITTIKKVIRKKIL